MIEPPGFQDPDGRYTLSSGNAHNWREAGHLKDSCPKAATSAGVDCTPSTCDCSLGSSPHWYTNFTFIPPGAGQMAPCTPQPNSEARPTPCAGSVAFCRLRPPVHSVTPRVPFPHGTRTRTGPIMLPQSNLAAR